MSGFNITINITVCNETFFRDVKVNIMYYVPDLLIKIGEVIIPFFDLIRTKWVSDWYMLKSKNDIIGQIHITFKFDQSEEEISSNLLSGNFF